MLYISLYYSSIFSSLYYFNGPTTDGSLRDIHLIRNGKKIGTVDIYKYLFSGNPVNDLRLVDQDIIYVPSRLSTIALTGQIKKPGYYEMTNNETINDLINLAGGKMLRSSEMIFLHKNNSDLNDAFLIEFDQMSKKCYLSTKLL